MTAIVTQTAFIVCVERVSFQKSVAKFGHGIYKFESPIEIDD
jgi:hypothetical protein